MPSADESTTSCPSLSSPEMTYVPGAVIVTVLPAISTASDSAVLPSSARVMVLASAAAYETLATPATKLGLIGALLFAFSDSVLAVRQFNGPYRGAQPLILSSYWLAIGLIAASHWA